MSFDNSELAEIFDNAKDYKLEARLLAQLILDLRDLRETIDKK